MVEVQRVRLVNFRGIQSDELHDVRPITGLWGKNGVGKSTYLQAIALVKNLTSTVPQGNPDGNGMRKVSGGGLVNSVINAANRNALQLGALPELCWRKNTFPVDVSVTLSDDVECRFTVAGNDSCNVALPTVPVLDGIRYFPPIRAVITESSPITANVDRDFGVNPQNIHTYLHWFIHERGYPNSTPEDLKELERLNYWMARFGMGNVRDMRDEPQNNQAVKSLFTDEITGADVAWHKAGFGGRNFATVLLEAMSFKNGVLLIEEPEISFHPGAQADILEFFVEMVKDRRHQIVFTSHSEYLLKRMARYLRDTPGDKDLFSVRYVEKSKDGGKAKVMPVEDLIGRLQRDVPMERDLHDRSPHQAR